MTGRWVGSALLLAAAVGCSSGPGSPSNGGEVNIGLNNQTGRTIAVTIVNGTKWNSGAISVSSGAYVTDEFGPTAAGDVIFISSAPTPDGTWQ